MEPRAMKSSASSRDGSRRIMAISQVSLDDDGKVLVEDLFRYRIDKISPEKVKGTHEKKHPPPTVGWDIVPMEARLRIRTI